jgi:hypothetical protein
MTTVEEGGQRVLEAAVTVYRLQHMLSMVREIETRETADAVHDVRVRLDTALEEHQAAVGLYVLTLDSQPVAIA